MKNPFKKIEKPFSPVPQELKAKVMKDVAYARLLMEIASLFSINLANIVEKTISDRN
jgi:hypothetical protein